MASEQATSENARLPIDIGVIGHPSECTIVIYRLVDLYEPVESEYHTGGTLTQHIKSGRKTYEAHRLGETKLLELTPELRGEIERDIGKRGIELP